MKLLREINCNKKNSDLFINKNKTPRDMKEIDKSKLPVDYYQNKKARQDTDFHSESLFKEVE